MTARSSAILRALLVSFLWSTSWLFIRAGLKDIPPLTFAALRYSMAAVILWGFVFVTHRGHEVRALPPVFLVRVVVLGVVFYSITQACQFVALNHLNATTVSLLLSFSTVIAAIIARASLRERTRPWQWAGVAGYVTAAVVFLMARMETEGDWVGYTVAALGVVANAAASVLGREVNRAKQASSAVVTVVSMTVGSIVLLVVALSIEGLPVLGWQQWAILAWLAVVNTAVAFVLWNRAQQELKAVETSVINNTMLFQIAVLAVLFMGEHLSLVQWAMILLGGIGALVVQLPSARADERPGQ